MQHKFGSLCHCNKLLLIGRSMAATKRHLRVNLADIEGKEKNVLLDAPVSISELFAPSIEMVVGKFRQANACSTALFKLLFYSNHVFFFYPKPFFYSNHAGSNHASACEGV